MQSDTKRPPRWRRVGKVLYTFSLYYLVGIWCYLFFVLPYRRSGKLIVHGQERYEAALKRGRVVIVANHPAVIESYFLSVLLCGSFWKSIPELWPYSLPDPATFLPRWLWWFFPLIRCVTVQRGNASSRSRALVRSIELLREGECLVIHPEGGRTTKGTEFIFGPEGRKLRIPLEQGVTTIVGAAIDVEVLPVWIAVQGETLTHVLSFSEAFKRGLEITIGEPFAVSSREKGRVGRTKVLNEIALQILHANHTPRLK